MGKKIKRILAISLILNLAFVFVSGFILYKKGGISYLINKSKTVNSNAISKYTPNYYLETSAYDILPKDENSIIFLGDSLTDFGSWYELLQNPNIKNRGISGDTTEGVIDRISEITNEQPQKVFIMVGINDLVQGFKMNEITDNYAKIIQKIKEESPNTKIYVQSVLPINNSISKLTLSNDTIVLLNKDLKNLTIKEGLQYVDLFSLFNDNGQLNTNFTVDGIHLKGQGYLVWTEAIKTLVTQ